MKYYTYTNPNKTGGRTNWGDDVHGVQLEEISKSGCLRMAEDRESSGQFGAGHAICYDDSATISHPNFILVDATGPDGQPWWDVKKEAEA